MPHESKKKTTPKSMQKEPQSFPRSMSVPGAGFTTDIWLNCDTNRANKRFICDTCGKSFLKLSNAQVHQITHQNQRNFQCRNCGAFFKQKGSMTRHLSKGICLD